MADPRNLPVNRIITPENPGAGLGFTLTPEGGGHWLIRTLRFTLVSDATVATRAVMLDVTNGNTPYSRMSASATQVAALTRVYSGQNGSQADAAIGAHIPLRLPLDGIWLPQGHSLVVGVENIQAADQISAIAAHVFEFPTGPGEHVWPFITTLREESS